MTDYMLVPVLQCAACGNAKPVSEMETCMHNQMHRYVCDSKCMNDFYNPPKSRRHDAAPAVQGEPVGEVRFEFGVPSSIFAELYSKSLPVLAPGTKLYAAPQPAPDVAGLVEALERLVVDVERATHVELGGTPWLKEKMAEIDYARAALAAYRKQEPSHDP